MYLCVLGNRVNQQHPCLPGWGSRDGWGLSFNEGTMVGAWQCPFAQLCVVWWSVWLWGGGKGVLVCERVSSFWKEWLKGQENILSSLIFCSFFYSYFSDLTCLCYFAGKLKWAAYTHCYIYKQFLSHKTDYYIVFNSYFCILTFVLFQETFFAA